MTAVARGEKAIEIAVSAGIVAADAVPPANSTLGLFAYWSEMLSEGL